MIDQNLLESLSSSDKESFARGLKELITQTYEVEKEFVELKALFEEVLDVLPTAVWVLESEGEIFYQNSLACEIPEILEKLDMISPSDTSTGNQQTGETEGTQK